MERFRGFGSPPSLPVTGSATESDAASRFGRRSGKHLLGGRISGHGDRHWLRQARGGEIVDRDPDRAAGSEGGPSREVRQRAGGNQTGRHEPAALELACGKQPVVLGLRLDVSSLGGFNAGSADRTLAVGAHRRQDYRGSSDLYTAAGGAQHPVQRPQGACKRRAGIMLPLTGNAVGLPDPRRATGDGSAGQALGGFHPLADEPRATAIRRR